MPEPWGGAKATYKVFSLEHAERPAADRHAGKRGSTCLWADWSERRWDLGKHRAVFSVRLCRRGWTRGRTSHCCRHVYELCARVAWPAPLVAVEE